MKKLISKKLTKDYLYKEYIINKKSTKEISLECSCSVSTINRRLKEFGIKTRRYNEFCYPNVRYDLLNNKEFLYKEYVIKKKTTIEIAEECKCGSNTVSRHLKEFGIKIRLPGEDHNRKIEYELLNNKEWLKQKYLIETLNTKEISKLCNCGITTINRKLKEFDIPLRGDSESKNLNAKWNLINDKSFINKEYNIKKKSSSNIAKKCNCSNNLILRKLKEFNLKIRKGSIANNPHINIKLLKDKKWMYTKYIIERESSYTIANICNCSFSTAIEWLKKHNIPIIERIGENSPMWKGGISFEPYCSKFNNQLKEYIRDSFDRKCFLCEKLEEDNKCKLHVHHVDYNKGQGCGYSWSLIPLCSSCHMKTNHNRYYWFNLLNNYWLLNPKINFYNIILYDHFYKVDNRKA